MQVRAQYLVLDAPASVMFDSVFTVGLLGVDIFPVDGDLSAVNIDEDFGAALPLDVEMSGAFEVVYETSRSLSLRIASADAQDGQQLPLRVTDNDGLVATTTIAIAVDAVALALSVDGGTVMPAGTMVAVGSTFILTVHGVDVAGRRDFDFALPVSMTSTQLLVNNNSSGVLWERAGPSTLAVRLLNAIAGEVLNLRVDSLGLVGQLMVLPTVGVQQLQLTAPSVPVVLGSTFTLTVTGVDGSGNVDPFYALPSASMLRLVAAPAAVLSLERVGLQQLQARLQSFQGRLDNPPSTATLTVTADGLEGSVVIDIRVAPVALRLALPSEPIVAGTTFTLSVTAHDALGNRQLDYDLNAFASLDVEIAPASVSLAWYRDGPDTVRVQLQRLGTGIPTLSTLTLTVRSGVPALEGAVAVSPPLVVADQLVVSLVGVGPIVVGTTFTLTVLAQDRFGNIAPDHYIGATTPTLSITPYPEVALSAARVINADQVALALLEPVPGPLSLRVRSGALSAALTLTRPLVQATRLALEPAVAAVTVGTTFTLTVTAVDDAGFRDVFYDLRDQALSVMSLPTASFEQRLLDAQTLELRFLSAPSSTLTLTVGSSTGTDTLLGMAALQLHVVPLRLELQPDRFQVAAGSSFVITVRAVDALGNHSLDFDLRDASLSLSSTPAVPWNARAISANLIEAQAWAGHESTVTLTVSSGGLSGDAMVRVIAPSRLALSVSTPTVVVGVTVVRLAVEAYFANGDADATFSLHLPTLEITASNGAELVYSVASTNTVLVTLTRAMDNSTVTLTVRTLGLDAAHQLRAQVVATRLALSLEDPSIAPVLPDTDFVLLVRGEDALGNVDGDFALSATVSAAVSSGTGMVAAGSTARLSDSRLRLQLTEVASAAATVVLGVLSGGLSGEIELPTLSLPSRLALSVSTSTVVVGVTVVRLAVEAYFANGDVDATFSLHYLPTLDITASNGAELVYSVASTNTVLVTLTRAMDNSTVTLTVRALGLDAAHQLRAQVVATRLALSLEYPSIAAPVLPDTDFVLLVRGEDALGNVDEDFALSATVSAAVSSGTGMVAAGSTARLSDTRLRLQLTEVASAAATVVLGVLSGGLSGEIELPTISLPSRLALSASTSTVVVGVTVVRLAVEAYFANGDVDATFSLHYLPTLDITASNGAELVYSVASTNTVLVTLTRAMDNSTVTLTVRALGLDAAHQLRAQVVATRLALSLEDPSIAPVLPDTDFVLLVRGGDALGNVDGDFALSATVSAAVSSGTGMVAAGSTARLSDTRLRLQLTEVASAAATVALGVLSGGLSGEIELPTTPTTALPSLDVDSTGDVETVDATLILRVLLLPDPIRGLLLVGDPLVAGLAVAGFPALTNDEAAIVQMILDLVVHSSGVLDLDLNGFTNPVDATLMLRVLLLPDPIRDLLLAGDPLVAGLVVAGFPALVNDEAAIVQRILDRTGN